MPDFCLTNRTRTCHIFQSTVAQYIRWQVTSKPIPVASIYNPQCIAGMNAEEAKRNMTKAARDVRKALLDASRIGNTSWVAKSYVPVAKKTNHCRACGLALVSETHTKRCSTHCYSCQGPKENPYLMDCNACIGKKA